MNLNTNSITKVKYNYNNIELFVNSKFAKSQFLSARQLLSNYDYSSLFIRSSLLIHLDDYKCVLDLIINMNYAQL